jgi:hypothetical protein
MAWYDRILTGGLDPEADQKRGEDAEAALREDNKKKLASGAWDQQQYTIATQHIDAGVVNDAQGQVYEQFGVGFDEGAANINDIIGKGITGAISTPLKLIPWQAWVLLAIFLGFKFNLFGNLFGKKS